MERQVYSGPMNNEPANGGESGPSDELAAEIDARAAAGRMPGRRGLATRQRLLDATAEQLESCGYRDLKALDIARTAGTSPAQRHAENMIMIGMDFRIIAFQNR